MNNLIYIIKTKRMILFFLSTLVFLATHGSIQHKRELKETIQKEQEQIQSLQENVAALNKSRQVRTTQQKKINAPSVLLESGMIATKGAEWNFEISNKAKLIPIFVTLNTVNGIIINKKRIENGGKLRASLDSYTISSPLQLTIHHGISPLESAFVAQINMRCLQKDTHGNCLNTAFLTFECPTTFFIDARLRPQRGILGGLAGISESGVSLRYNIRPNQITIQQTK